MQVLIRNPQRRSVASPGGRTVADLLRELRLNPETHIVIRGRDLLTGDEWLSDDDSIEIVSAISGGAPCAASNAPPRRR